MTGESLVQRRMSPTIYRPAWFGFAMDGSASITSHLAQWVLDTVLTGNFKASPARFKYFISLTSDKISKLPVEFRGSVR
jgi:hypothetical protein